MYASSAVHVSLGRLGCNAYDFMMEMMQETYQSKGNEAGAAFPNSFYFSRKLNINPPLRLEGSKPVFWIMAVRRQYGCILRNRRFFWLSEQFCWAQPSQKRRNFFYEKLLCGLSLAAELL